MEVIKLKDTFWNTNNETLSSIDFALNSDGTLSQRRK